MTTRPIDWQSDLLAGNNMSVV